MGAALGGLSHKTILKYENGHVVPLEVVMMAARALLATQQRSPEPYDKEM